ncbi:MAG: GNAT family N-acetyltransferase [Sutterellaceae bacterium]|nr:GNAT family N-acetyltransferase [Burkholderiaceae bacterium]MDW8429184.1 GNAT family N-acetyltransferase [Sutterellaceae bacterium]
MKWYCHRLDRFDGFAGEWDQLATASAPHAPFLRASFMRPLFKHFADGSERLLLATDGGQPVALAVVRRTRPGVWQTFQPAQAPLGAFVSQRNADVATLLRGAVAALPGMALSLGLTQQDPLAMTRPADDGRIVTLDYIETAWIELEGSFEAYWDARGKNLRHNIRRQHAKLSEQGTAMRLETLTAVEQVLPGLRDYGALESAGWKAAQGTAIHVDNVQGRFYRDMLEAFCAERRGRIYRLWFDNRVVAVDLCIESDDTLVILKTTYDESVPQGFSPAVLLLHAAVQDLYRQQRIRRVEFYGKLMDWHKRWTDRSRCLYHVNYDRWPWVRRARAAWRSWRSGPPNPAAEQPPGEAGA